jgi:hypothetical protein
VQHKPADAAAPLLAVEIRLGGTERGSRRDAGAAAVGEGRAMVLIGAALRDDVDAPVALRLVETSKDDVETWNSWMDSWVRLRVVLPTCSSTASMPSIVIRASRPVRPPMETPV